MSMEAEDPFAVFYEDEDEDEGVSSGVGTEKAMIGKDDLILSEPRNFGCGRWDSRIFSSALRPAFKPFSAPSSSVAVQDSHGFKPLQPPKSQSQSEQISYNPKRSSKPKSVHKDKKNRFSPIKNNGGKRSRCSETFSTSSTDQKSPESATSSLVMNLHSFKRSEPSDSPERSKPQLISKDSETPKVSHRPLPFGAGGNGWEISPLDSPAAFEKRKKAYVALTKRNGGYRGPGLTPLRIARRLDTQLERQLKMKKTKKSGRYFSGGERAVEENGPWSLRCFHCGALGHRLDSCQQAEETQLKVCQLCGDFEHKTSKCTRKLCAVCLKDGHLAEKCPLTQAQVRRRYCSRCQLIGHLSEVSIIQVHRC